MLTRLSRGLMAALVLVTAASCTNDTPTQPVVFVGPATLVVTDVRVGTGPVFSLGQEATVHYGLWVYDPTGIDNKGTFVQDSRLVGSGQPFTTRLAAGSIIQGWIDGLPGMRVGGLRRLIIPPSLAYGAQGNDPIPPNAWIVFDIDLLSIKD